MRSQLIAPKKILVVKLRSMGDTLLLSAPLAILRQTYPGAQIHVAITKKWAPLLEHHPAIDKVFHYERHQETTARARAIARLGFELRKERYDCVLNFHASPSSAALSFATGAPVRSIHFHGHKDKNRYSTVLVPGKGVLKPIIERDMDTVRALGVEIPEGLLPKIYLTNEEINQARSEFEQRELGHPVLALGLGASRPTKSWPTQRYASLARLWMESTGGSVVAFVGYDELRIEQAFCDALSALPQSEKFRKDEISKRVLTLRGESLRKMASWIQQSDFFCGNDSGPKHVAVAVGTPTVTLFGPEDPFEWHPYPKEKHQIVFREGLTCRRDQQPGFRPWCGIEVCIEERHRCMTDISELEVFQLLHQRWSQAG